MGPEIANLLHLHKEFMALASQLELKSYEKPLCVNQIEQNKHQRLGELLGALEQEVEEVLQEASTEQ